MPTISPEKVHAAAQRGVAKRQEASRRAAMAALAPRTHPCEWVDCHNTLDGDVFVEECRDPGTLIVVDGSFGPIAIAACPEHRAAFTTT